LVSAGYLKFHWIVTKLGQITLCEEVDHY